jgi:hypothetical protein
MSTLLEFQTAAPCNRNEQLRALRGLLAEKFPVCRLKPAGVLPTGLPGFDVPETGGGLRRGAVTEVTGGTGCGALLIEGLLGVLRRENAFGALVDAGDGFDCQGAALERLLWVRCTGALQAVKAVDLLLRDGNLPLVMLDLQMLPVREVRKIPATTWHRFHKLVEPLKTALVVLSRQPSVEGAPVRIALEQAWTLEAMRERRGTLLRRLEPRIYTRQRGMGTENAELRRLSA